jgi:hypothetical protein
MIRPAYKVFNGGIISPLLYHRSDLEIYGRSCKELKNMIPLPTGAVTRRSGTKFLTGTLKDGTATDETRLIPFARSGNVFYLLEFCDKYIRVLFDGLPIELDANEIDLWDNTKVYNVNEYVKINDGTQDVIYVAKHATKNENPLTSVMIWEKTEYYILITPYKYWYVDDLKYIESFDYMYFVHPWYPVYKLINGGLGNMRFERVRFNGNFFNDGNTETYKQVALALDEVNNNPSATIGEFIPNEYYGVDAVIYYNNDFYKAKQNVDYNISRITPDVNDEYWEAIGNPEHTNGEDTVISTGSMLHLKTKDVDFEDGDHLLIKISNSYANVHHRFEHGSDAGKSTKAILVKGKWNFYTHGTWKGVLEIQRSFDYGTTWETYRTFASTRDANYDINGDEKESGVLYRVYCKEITIDTDKNFAVKVDFVVNEAYFESEGIVRIQNGNTYFQLLNPILAGMVDTDSDLFEDCDTKTYLYAYSAWSRDYGFPQTVTINEERLCFGGNRNKQMTVWMSRSNDFENLNQGAEATDALAFTLNSETIYPIKFLLPARGLFVSTAGDEWILTGNKAGEPISPTSFSARRIGSAGSNGIQGISLGSSIIFVQGDNKTIREMHYDFQIDGYISNDLTNTAEHITESGIKDLTLQKTKWMIIWFVRNDGVLIGLTYDANQKVFAFHKHDTRGKFKRIVSINVGEDSDVYVECEREIIDASGDSKNVYLIEKFDRLDTPDNHGEINYLDCYFVEDRYYEAQIEAVNILSKTPLEIKTTNFLPQPYIQVIKPENPDIRWEHFPLKYEYFKSTPTHNGSFNVRNVLNISDWSEPYNFCDWEGVALKEKFKQFTINTDIYGFGDIDLMLDDTYSGKNNANDSGVVETNEFFSKILYGYNFTSILEPTNFEIQVGDGSSTGLRKRIIETIIGLYNTIGLNVYAQDDEKMDIIYRMLTDDFDNPSELFTGMKKVKFSHGYDRESFMKLVQELPYPATITFLQVWHDAFN